jgi:hypothetical protein
MTSRRDCERFKQQSFQSSQSVVRAMVVSVWKSRDSVEILRYCNLAKALFENQVKNPGVFRKAIWEASAESEVDSLDVLELKDGSRRAALHHSSERAACSTLHALGYQPGHRASACANSAAVSPRYCSPTRRGRLLKAVKKACSKNSPAIVAFIQASASEERRADNQLCSLERISRVRSVEVKLTELEELSIDFP